MKRLAIRPGNHREALGKPPEYLLFALVRAVRAQVEIPMLDSLERTGWRRIGYFGNTQGGQHFGVRDGQARMHSGTRVPSICVSGTRCQVIIKSFGTRFERGRERAGRGATWERTP